MPLVLACNVPVAIIGSAAVPLCFKPPPKGDQLPSLSQKSALMDSVVCQKVFSSEFARAVHTRTRSRVIFKVDNCGAHTALECDGVKISPLPPDKTSGHRLKDPGIIASLKRRYRRRLIFFVLRAFPEY